MGSYPEMDGRLKPPVVHVFATRRTNIGFGGSNLLMVCCVSFQSVLLLKTNVYKLYIDVVSMVFYSSKRQTMKSDAFLKMKCWEVFFHHVLACHESI